MKVTQEMVSYFEGMMKRSTVVDGQTLKELMDKFSITRDEAKEIIVAWMEGVYVDAVHPIKENSEE